MGVCHILIWNMGIGVGFYNIIYYTINMVYTILILSYNINIHHIWYVYSYSVMFILFVLFNLILFFNWIWSMVKVTSHFRNLQHKLNLLTWSSHIHQLRSYLLTSSKFHPHVTLSLIHYYHTIYWSSIQYWYLGLDLIWISSWECHLIIIYFHIYLYNMSSYIPYTYDKHTVSCV